MAKALFQKGERVFVKPVGTWARVENLLPQWVKGVEEPLKVQYDVGLGREFQAHELMAEPKAQKNPTEPVENETWRLLRARTDGMLIAAEERFPHPGTYPVIVTDALEWGGWRVPAAEYERDPDRIEDQARVLVNGLRLMRIVTEMTRYVAELGEAAPEELKALAQQAECILDSVYGDDFDASARSKQDEDVSPALRPR